MIEYRGPNQKPSMKQQDYSFLLRNFLKHYSLYLFSFLVLVSFIILLSSTSVSKADVTLDLKCKKGAGVILDQPYTFKFLELSSGKMKASFVNEDKTNFNVIGDDRALMWLVANFGSKLIFKFFLHIKTKIVMFHIIEMNEEELNELKEAYKKFKNYRYSARDFDLHKNNIIERNRDSERVRTDIFEDCSGSIFK